MGGSGWGRFWSSGALPLARRDGYWAAYIVKGHKSTRVKVTISIRSAGGVNAAQDVDTLWADVHWINYGPFGRLALARLHQSDPEQAEAMAERYGACTGRQAKQCGMNWAITCDV